MAGSQTYTSEGEAEVATDSTNIQSAVAGSAQASQATSTSEASQGSQVSYGSEGLQESQTVTTSGQQEAATGNLALQVGSDYTYAADQCGWAVGEVVSWIGGMITGSGQSC